MIRAFLLTAVILIFSGCSKVPDKISPTFISEGQEMEGTEGKIGILGPNFFAGKSNKHMWHFWGTKEELNGKLKVEAINQKTGEKVHPFSSDIPASLGGPNNGADGHLPSTMELPVPGVWELNAYIDANLFGSIIVEVKSLN